MIRLISLLFTVAIITLSAQGQIKLRLQSDDVVESGFLTTTNANTLLGGLNSSATITLSAIRGGTGQSAYALGDLLYANSTAGLGRLPAAQGLLTGGATPVWASTSAGIRAALSDETGTGSLVFGVNPVLNVPTFSTAVATGAGMWFDGNTTGTRAFLGMAPLSDTSFRLFSTAANGDVWNANLTTREVVFAGNIQANSGAFNSPLVVRNNTASPQVVTDFTNLVDTNLQVIITQVGSGTKFSSLGSTTDTAVQFRQANATRITLETDDSITLSGPLRIPDGTSSVTSVRFGAGHGIYNRDNANKTISFGTGAGGNPVFEVVAQTDQINFGTSYWLFGTFADARSNREKLGTITRYKAAATTRVATTTPTADPDLQVNLGPNEVWKFEIFARVFAESEHPDWKSGIAIPTNASIRYGGRFHVNVDGLIFESNAATPGGGLNHNFPGTGFVHCLYYGTVITGADSGVFSLNWSQLNSHADDITVDLGSTMILTRLN
jgi:hypothetical protein